LHQHAKIAGASLRLHFATLFAFCNPHIDDFAAFCNTWTTTSCGANMTDLPYWHCQSGTSCRNGTAKVADCERPLRAAPWRLPVKMAVCQDGTVKAAVCQDGSLPRWQARQDGIVTAKAALSLPRWQARQDGTVKVAELP